MTNQDEVKKKMAEEKAAELAKGHPIPAPPWTAEALGWEKYVALAKAYQVADPKKGEYEPSLDLSKPYEEQQGGQVKKPEPFKITMDKE